MQKLKVGVLMGGMSIEKEVSFNSGRTICDHLDTSLYNIIPLFQTLENQLYILPWYFLHRGKISDFEHTLKIRAQEIMWDDLPGLIDFMYIATHGRYAEDGSLQGFLELLNIPYLGSKVRASALGMDKVLQKKILALNSISVPRDVTITPEQCANLQKNPEALSKLLEAHNLTFPLLVKPAHEGSSLGVSYVSTFAELLPALESATTIDPLQSQPALVEEFITGMEFSCIVVHNPHTHQLEALTATEVVCEEETFFHDYEQKYMPGRATKYTPARCQQKDLDTIKNACISVMHALEFKTIGRIDGFLKQDGTVVIIEPNSLSGMGPSSFIFNQAAFAGMNHQAFINYLIASELSCTPLYKNFYTMIQKQTSDSSQKLKVAVIFGGPSNEKEVSLDSGRNVCYKLSSASYNIIPLFMNSHNKLYHISPTLLVHNTTHEIEQELDPATHIPWHQLALHADFVFIALHGAPGEDGTIQGILEMLKLPYNGSGIATSAICMDKFKTNQLIKAAGFDIPTSMLVSKTEWLNSTEETLTIIAQQFMFPLILKPHDDGCSVMVQKIKTEEQLKEHLNSYFKSTKTYVMLEEYIQGTELTVGVIGNQHPKALVPSQTISKKDFLSMEEKFLPGAGENQTPALLPQETLQKIQRTIEQVFTTLSCTGYARIDCFYQSPEQSPTGQERIIPLEVNTLPALTPATCIFHQAAEMGITPREFLDTIIMLGLEKHAHTQKTKVHQASLASTPALAAV